MANFTSGLENGAATNLKSPQCEAEGIGAADPTHRLLAAQKLVRRLKIQHAEMSRTILALENLPRDRRQPKVSRGRKSK